MRGKRLDSTVNDNLKNNMKVKECLTIVHFNTFFKCLLMPFCYDFIYGVSHRHRFFCISLSLPHYFPKSFLFSCSLNVCLCCVHNIISRYYKCCH
ncbi:hypothetical protein PFLUV_G00111170 [Perca fluviatilis]|uniref:Uncharacterized protein n=1 Tax=Perca fluviatilis TaxID=8168 RepID=A0A6A5F9E3_PERFL|nr:hypothetical protein PFLUV_G00111170 [Perca fluviatilis]